MCSKQNMIDIGKCNAKANAMLVAGKRNQSPSPKGTNHLLQVPTRNVNIDIKINVKL